AQHDKEGGEQAEGHLEPCFDSSRGRHTRSKRDWSSDVCASDLYGGLNAGVKQRLNPPYPFKSTGCSPSNAIPLRCVRNIGIIVPSLDGYITWVVSKSFISTGSFV